MPEVKGRDISPLSKTGQRKTAEKRLVRGACLAGCGSLWCGGIFSASPMLASPACVMQGKTAPNGKQKDLRAAAADAP